jgi:hypothetical protein
VRGVIIIQGTYSTVLRNGNSLGKRGLAIFQEELLQNFFSFLVNHVLMFSNARATLNLHCSNIVLFSNSLETFFFFEFFLGLMLHCQELHLKSFPFEEFKIARSGNYTGSV